MKVRVTDRCQGHMQCVLAAPHIFIIDEEMGHAHVSSPDVAPADEHAVRLAVRSCPERAIEIAEVDFN